MVDSSYKPGSELPGNSKRDRVRAATPKAEDVKAKDAKKEAIKPIVQGSKKKTSLTKRMGQTFKGDDANSVGSYILFDVALPAVKNLVADAVSQGIERLLFGESTSRRSSSGVRTNYSGIARSSTREPPSSARRELSERARAAHDFDEIILETRGDAERVLDTLRDMIDTFDAVSVADLLALVDITPEFTDDKYGWVDLRSARVTQVRAGYLLDLPRPIQL